MKSSIGPSVLRAVKEAARRMSPSLYRGLARMKHVYVLTFGYHTPQLRLDYDDYWDRKVGPALGKLSDFREARAAAIGRLIPRGATVLDLGCGDCAILAYLREKIGVEGIGVDLSPKMVAFGREQGFAVIHADLRDTKVLNEFPETEYVLASEVLEHIPEPEVILAHYRTKGIKVIITVPNTGYVRHRIRLLLGRAPMQWVIHPGEHLRFWTLKDLHWWLGEIGWRIDAIVPYAGVPVLRALWPSLFSSAVAARIVSLGNGHG